MIRQSLFFTAPREVSILSEDLTDPGEGQVLVRTLVSAISPGTEMLIYRGLFPKQIQMDDTIAALSGDFTYPFKYGYAAIGLVEAVGSRVEKSWQGRQVFSFQPHQTHFLSKVEDLHPLPEGITTEEAAFLPNMETAVNFLMDGAPLIGEGVAVFGQGIVGLLTTALLGTYPLARLVTFDRYPLRRQASLALGAHASLDPADPEIIEQVRQSFPQKGPYSGADLVYELSGSPVALNQAISLTGFAGRLVVGSWYGDKPVNLELGGRFHRARLRLVSSQVSSLAPRHRGGWSKTRRLEVAWKQLVKIRPERLITHRFPFSQADRAYRLLDEDPGNAIQVLLIYS
jgi:2-desacetyl-2-hydroxyethyl bacteriochlorophyllide A dehydrogenase